jgi:hypothetical protein
MFAQIYAEKFVSQGWKSTFPSNIEKITGRKFDPEAFVAALARDLEPAANACDKILSK